MSSLLVEIDRVIANHSGGIYRKPGIAQGAADTGEFYENDIM